MKKFLTKTWLKHWMNKKVTILVLSCAAIIALLFTSPIISLALGNIFFGKVSAFYNVTLAQFFFSHATSPLIGNAPMDAHHQLGRTHFIKGDFDKAIDEAEKELELYPDNLKAYYVLGLTYGYMNQERKAIENFRHYVEQRPSSWAGRNDMAWLQFRIGDVDGAIATIQPVTHDTENPWVQNTYGVLLMNKKRYMEAKGAFLHAQRAANSIDESRWGRAYPGNDPRIYSTGLSAMRASIKNNLELIEENIP